MERLYLIPKSALGPAVSLELVEMMRWRGGGTSGVVRCSQEDSSGCLSFADDMRRSRSRQNPTLSVNQFRHLSVRRRLLCFVFN